MAPTSKEDRVMIHLLESPRLSSELLQEWRSRYKILETTDNRQKTEEKRRHSVNLVSNLCAYFSYVLFNLVLLYRTNLKAKTYVNIINIPGVKLMCVFLVCAF